MALSRVRFHCDEISVYFAAVQKNEKNDQDIEHSNRGGEKNASNNLFILYDGDWECRVLYDEHISHFHGEKTNGRKVKM